MKINKSRGAFSLGLILDFIKWKPHVHILVGGRSLTIGSGWSFENIHEHPTD